MEPHEGCSKDSTLWKNCRQLHRAVEEPVGLLMLALGPPSVAVSPVWGLVRFEDGKDFRGNKDVWGALFAPT